MSTTVLRDKRQSARARKFVAVLAIAPALVPLFTETTIPPATRTLAVVLWILCLSPAYSYFATDITRRRPLPFLPAVSLLYGLYYTLPLVLGVTDQYYKAPVDPSTDYDYPVQLAFFGWIAMMAAYRAASLAFRRKKLPTPTPWRPRHLAYWGLVLLYGGLVAVSIRSMLSDYSSVGGVFQFLISLQWLGVALLLVLVRREEVGRPHKIALLIGVLAIIVANLAGGSIAPLVMFCVVLGLAYWLGKPVISAKLVAAAVVVMLVSVTLRGVALDFRNTVWFGTAQLSQTEQAVLMLRLAEARVENIGVLAAIGKGFETTAGRSANMDLFANVVRRTPSEVPYWSGETYLSLIGTFVPRVLWPDKPTKELGQAFGHRYGYIYWTNRSTAINLPFMVEFFANFGGWAVVAGMFLVGIIYRALDDFVNRPGQDILMSVVAVVLLPPLLLLESDFSLIFGGLPLNALALMIVLSVLRRRGKAPAGVTTARTVQRMSGEPGRSLLIDHPRPSNTPTRIRG